MLVHELSTKQGQQHVLWKFEQFLKHQPKFKLAHELPHAKVLTMVQLTVQNTNLLFKKFNQNLNIKTASSLGF